VVSKSCGYRFSDLKVKINILKQSLILSNSMHDFRNLDFININVSKVGFKNAAFTFGKDICSHTFTIVGKNINNFLLNGEIRELIVLSFSSCINIGYKL